MKTACLSLMSLLSLTLLGMSFVPDPSADTEKKTEPATIKVGEQTVLLSKPFSHENLTVFLLHGKDRSKANYVTLDEGLAKKLITVSEKKNEQVSELVIENTSDRPLFLQEGDRLSGGKQDRIIVTSLIVPAKSGKMPLPTFCIEQSRWTEGKKGKQFGNANNPVLAAQQVRIAAKVTPMRGGQHAVWRNVAILKADAMKKLDADNKNSSLNETYSSKKVIEICNACSKKLDGIVKPHKDVIGFAIAINGEIEEVNVYPNHQLAAKLYPRLVQSYAVQAALAKDEKKKPKEVKADDVSKFLVSTKQKGKRTEKVNADNSLRVTEHEKFFRCVTEYKGMKVHQQWLKNRPMPKMEQTPLYNPNLNPRQQNDRRNPAP